MKNLKLNILAYGMALAGLTACSESFLDVNSITDTTTDNFYKDLVDAEKALIGCYGGWRETTSKGPWPAFYIASQMMSDECFGGGGGSDANCAVLDRFDMSWGPSEVNLYNSLWEYSYLGIYRCNILLQKLDDIDWGDTPDERYRIEGETRVLRALIYFDLVRILGNIPLLTEPSEENVPQADPADVYKVIAEDLLFAANNIPEDAYPKAEADKNDGRITCWAAKALLARVYLYYTGYYGQADLVGVVNQSQVLQGLEDVINSGEFGLVEEFKNLWPAASTTPVGDQEFESTYEGDGNIETVLAQKFNNTTTDWNGNSNNGNRWLTMLGLRSTTHSPYGTGWGQCTVHPKMWNSFDANDTRREASIINLATEGIEYDIADQRDYTGYMNKKYIPLAYADGTNVSGSDFQITQDQDYVVMRYADVLLMAAELGSSKAQDYYNQVRTRAGVSTRTVTKENIMEERFLEFAFEGIRYWDLLRQGVDYAASVINESGVSVVSMGVDTQLTIDGSRISETRGLSRIPDTQIELSDGVLKQNAGW
ncbi:MAG: RagB/SusD family nutrient uptake outer membrane protein [Bacteroides sp.]|nr:RagB/SusD family nutrient uptake outer membrane protein [Bacteroides sp.]